MQCGPAACTYTFNWTWLCTETLYGKINPLLYILFPHACLVQPLECVQSAGDVLYVPARWSHATVNIDECIGLAVEFDTGDC